MSNSRVLHQRVSSRARLRRSVGFVYIGATLFYLAWRATIINGDALSLSIVYYVAEAIGFLLGLTVIFSSWDYRHRDPTPAPRGLSVDVFIPTYKEPIELVRWTIIGAKEIAYPHQTFVLDDGNRPEMKALAEELGVRYLARGRNVDAKAGNLNFGLAHSSAEFVMVLDADHIALPHALDVTLGFFRDERVAMVQTPQDFYNIDAFQFFNARRTGGLWHDQSFFYSIALPCRDACNGASCVGTGVVYRRSAIDAIGGIPVETVTEDMHTSVKLHKAGYEIEYLNEPLAYGVAASDIREYYKTRHRWAHGNIHVLRGENVPFGRGLSLGQRLSYLTLGVIYLEGWQQLLLFIVPIVSLLLGWAPFEITVLNVLVVLAFPIFAMLLLQEFGCGLSRIWVNEIFSVARFPIHIVAALALIRGRMPFRTSSKSIRGRVEWKLLAPQLAVCGLSLAALLNGVVHLGLAFKIGPLAEAAANIAAGAPSRVDWNARLDQGYTLELVVVAGFWALFNAVKSGYLVRKAVRDARRSSADYRFAVAMPLELVVGGRPCLARSDRISLSWASIRLYGVGVPASGERLVGRLHLPTGPLPFECVVTRRAAASVRRIAVEPDSGESSGTERRPDGGDVECELVWRHPELRDRLARSLYSVDWHREFVHRNAFFTTPLEALGRIFSLRAPFAARLPAWSPALCRHAGVEGYGILAEQGNRQGTLLVFRTLRPGALIQLEKLTSAGIEYRSGRILRQMPLRSLGARGLDGAEVKKYLVAIEESSLAIDDEALAVAAE